MFAVVRTGGKQYKVSPDDVIVVEKLPGDSGSSIQLADVLMVSDGTTTAVGKPVISGAKVAATVVHQAHAEKIIVLKFKRRHKYRRTAGHRQEVTVLRISEISAPGMATAKGDGVAKRTPPNKAAAAGGEAAPKKQAVGALGVSAADKVAAKTAAKAKPKTTKAKKS